MSRIQSFLMAPTLEQRLEIQQLCEKGKSSRFIGCYIQAPLQAVTSLTAVMKDIPYAPIRGLFVSVSHLSTFSLKEAKEAFLTGIGIGMRSIIQVAVIISAVFIGIFFPRFVYSKLEKLNSEENVKEIKLDSQSDQLSELEKENLILKKQLEQANEDFAKNLQTERDTKANEFTELQSKCTKLQNEKEQTENSLQIAKKQFNEKEVELNEVKKQLTQTQERSNKFQKEAQEKGEKVTSLLRENIGMKDQIAKSGEDLKKIQNEYLKIKRSDSSPEIQNKLKTLQKEKEEKENALKETAEKLAQALESKQNLQIELETTNEKLNASLLESDKTLKRANRKFQSEYTKLKNKYEDLVKENKKLQKDIDSSTENINPNVNTVNIITKVQ